MTDSRQKIIYDVAIIGAGASGMTAAISCARYFYRHVIDKNNSKNISNSNDNSSNISYSHNNNNNIKNYNSSNNNNRNINLADNKLNVIILERHAKSGRKLLATGNGRCNLSNENINTDNLDRYFHSNRPEFYKSILGKFTVADTIEFFDGIGIISTTLDEGKIYPYCKQAFSVVEALGHELRELGVKVLHSCEVSSIHKVNQGGGAPQNDKTYMSTSENESTNLTIKKSNSVIGNSISRNERMNSIIGNADLNINKINPGEDIFELTCIDLQERGNPEIQRIYAKNVIVSAGGKASPSLSSNGLGYGLLGSLGHTATPLFPSIVQLKTEKDINVGLDGMKWDVKISLVQPVDNPRSSQSRQIKLNEIESDKNKVSSSISEDGSSSGSRAKDSAPVGNNTPSMTIVKEEKGELLFTDYGISGPVVLQLARHACVIEGSKSFALIDFLPEYSPSEIFELLKKRIKQMANRPIRRLLIGILPYKLGLAITDKIFAGKADKAMKSITSQELANIITRIKGYPITITGTLGWDNAQVTAGGISCNEVDANTCESLICKNLYITGEVLDVDGDCGGFNLQFAWSSGFIAGESAARAICIKMNTAGSSDNDWKFNKSIDSDSKLTGEQQ